MRLALLGDPVEHSRSPAIHAAALAAAGIAGSYEARRVDRAGLAAALDEMRRGALDGANVTMPHKAAAAADADHADALVAATGAANTLRGRAGRVEATNTDVEGVVAAAAAAGIDPAAPVLVLGAGGAAAAVLAAFGIRVAGVASRRPAAAAALAARMGSAAAPHPWGAPLPGAVVVNATPLGMDGEALPPGLLEASAGLVDLAYGRHPTPAAAEAGERNLPCADGIEVLVAQAAASFTWWTGLPAPRAAMTAAARD